LVVALLLPAVSSLMLAFLPWPGWSPVTVNIARPWLCVTVLIGATGLFFAPMRGWLKVLAFAIYVPLMFLILSASNVVLVCIAEGPSACP
jgi:hypothetical protein